MRIPRVLSLTVFSIFFAATAVKADEANRILLQRFRVPGESDACQKFVAVSGITDGVEQVKALLALPEIEQPFFSLAQALEKAHLKPLPEYSVAIGQQHAGAYFVPVQSEEQGSIRFALVGEQEGKAMGFLLTLRAEAELRPRSVTLSSLDGNERYVLDLVTGESYYESPLAQVSASSTLSCLWDAIANSMPSFGTLVCSWGQIVIGCAGSALTQCPGIVGGVLGGVGCASGVDFAKNYLTCFGGSDTTPPSITSLSPTDGTTVTTPFSIACQASDNNSVQSISLLFDSDTIATCSGNSCSGSMNRAVTNTTVRHVVTCVAKDGASLSTSRSHSVWISGGGGGVPAAPSNLSASALSSSSIRFAWRDNASNETGFKVYRWNGSDWQQIGTAGSNATSYTDSGLRSATTYHYTVCANNSAGTNCASDYTSATTQSGSTPPTPPSGLAASALSSSSIRFSWQDRSSNETNFLVYRWTGSDWQKIGTVGANVTSYNDSGLRSAKTYYYTVCASNSAGSGCASDYTSATTR